MEISHVQKQYKRQAETAQQRRVAHIKKESNTRMNKEKQKRKPLEQTIEMRCEVHTKYRKCL